MKEEESNSILIFLFTFCTFLHDKCEKFQLSMLQKCLCTCPKKKIAVILFCTRMETHRNTIQSA